MTTFKKLFRTTILLATMLAFTTPLHSQFLKKLGKAAELAAQKTVENRVERETQKKTDAALDSILQPGAKKEKQSPLPQEDDAIYPEGHGQDGSKTDNDNISSSGFKSLAVYSKFDFVPGDTQLFFDDFSKDFIGDFPARWNTNGSGELVTIEGYPNKWLNILPGYNTAYIPDITNLPEEFTLEFDVQGKGLDNKTSSHSYLGISVSDNNTFNKAKNWGSIEYSFCQFIGRGIVVENNIAGKRIIRNEVTVDIRNTVKEKHHISIAVNRQRFRLWINEKKYIDVPRLLPENIQMEGIKFTLRGINTEKEAIYISNLKIAKGGVDLRRKLLADGKISTNGILFDSGSANIQPQSMGIIQQIYQVMQQDATIILKIVGHTDADGDDNTNKALSEKRAEAVKKALVNIYNILPNRLTTKGKGESEPVDKNNTPEGKEKNRRVEFIKQ
jgi:outer membrane protein OmpA-like peptidoglycan-associated protein